MLNFEGEVTTGTTNSQLILVRCTEPPTVQMTDNLHSFSLTFYLSTLPA